MRTVGERSRAYTVREGKDDGHKSSWTKIGAFFAHENVEGGPLLLEALLLDGRIVLRTLKGDSDRV